MGTECYYEAYITCVNGVTQLPCSRATSSQKTFVGCGKTEWPRYGTTSSGRDTPARPLRPTLDPGSLSAVITTCISSPASLGPLATKRCECLN